MSGPITIIGASVIGVSAYTILLELVSYSVIAHIPVISCIADALVLTADNDCIRSIITALISFIGTDPIGAIEILIAGIPDRSSLATA